MKCLVEHWLPGQMLDEDTMAEALYLEQRYWENMSNAIAKGFKQAL